LVVTVAVLGAAPDGGPVLRSGAQPGDVVYVTGALGGAKAALDQRRGGVVPPPDLHARMTRPVPRMAAGMALARAGATAMIDVSDGLAADLGHVLDESGVGVRVDGDRVPCDDGASLEQALFGGDDYELCFTAPDRDAVARAFAAAGVAMPAEIGVCTAEPARVLVAGNREEPLPARGWEHDIT